MQIVLNRGKNVSIVVMDDGKICVDFLNRLYDMETYKCIDTGVSLGDTQRKEAESLLPRARRELEKLKKEFEEPAPKVEPKKKEKTYLNFLTNI